MNNLNTSVAFSCDLYTMAATAPQNPTSIVRRVAIPPPTSRGSSSFASRWWMFLDSDRRIDGIIFKRFQSQKLWWFPKTVGLYGKIPLKWMIWGVPLFQETSKWDMVGSVSHYMIACSPPWFAGDVWVAGSFSCWTIEIGAWIPWITGQLLKVSGPRVDSTSD